MMRAQGADHQGAIGNRHVAQPGQLFYVDQALILDQPFFHRQEKLRAAGIDFRALAKSPQQFGSFRDTFRFFQAESSEHFTRLLLVLSSSSRRCTSKSSFMRLPILLSAPDACALIRVSSSRSRTSIVVGNSTLNGPTFSTIVAAYRFPASIVFASLQPGTQAMKRSTSQINCQTFSRGARISTSF